MINDYINALSGIRKERCAEIVNYVRENFSNIEESMSIPHTKFNHPSFALQNSIGDIQKEEALKIGKSLSKNTILYPTLFCIASMKNYLSLYFSRAESVKIIVDNIKGIDHGKGCIKYKDSDNWHFEVIKEAIIYNFKK